MEENNNQDGSNGFGLYDTHKFLYTLFYEGRIQGHEVQFIDRDKEEKTITLKDIEIGASPVSCKLYSKEGNRYIVPFVRIRKVFSNGELVWDNSEVDFSNTKVIKGYD